MTIYKKKPRGFSRKEAEAVACFVEDDKRCVLFLLRAKGKLIAPHKWASPAGRVEKRETKEQAMLRELREETGLKPEENRLLYTRSVYIVFKSGIKFVFHVFRLRYNCRPEIVFNDENEAVVWLMPEQALASLRLMEDEAECVRSIFELNTK